VTLVPAGNTEHVWTRAGITASAFAADASTRAGRPHFAQELCKGTGAGHVRLRPPIANSTRVVDGLEARMSTAKRFLAILEAWGARPNSLAGSVADGAPDQLVPRLGWLALSSS
jgi:hypothetical protein